MKKVLFLFIALLLLFTSSEANENIKKAKELIENKEFKEAKEILESLVDEDETNHEAFYILAQIYFSEGDIDKATDNAEAAVEITDENPDYHFLLGKIYGRDARTASVFRKPFLAKKCKNAFLRAIELDPEHLNGNMGLAEFMFYAPGIAGGDKEEAIKLAEKTVKIDEVSGLNLLTKYLLDGENPEEAKPSIDKLVELDEIKGRLRLLSYFNIKKDTVEIENQFVRLEKLIGEDVNYFWFYNRYGYALLGTGRVNEAIEKFKIQIKLAPQRAFVYKSLGDAYFAAGKYQDALNEYKKTLELNSDFDSAEDKIEEIEEILESKN